MEFPDWQKEVQRVLYEADASAFFISTVTDRECESYQLWKEMWQEGTKPKDAVEIAKKWPEV